MNITNRQQVIIEEVIRYIDNIDIIEKRKDIWVSPSTQQPILPNVIQNPYHQCYMTDLKRMYEVFKKVIDEDKFLKSDDPFFDLFEVAHLFQLFKFILNYIVRTVNARMMYLVLLKIDEIRYRILVEEVVKMYFDTLKGITIQNAEKEGIIATRGGFKKIIVN